MRNCEIDELSEIIIGAGIEVHRHLGPGLLESAYEECMCEKLKLLGLAFERQVPLPLTYKSGALDCSYRLDIVVMKRVIVELKAMEKFMPIHQAQVITYLKLSGLEVGLLMNFNVPVLKDGIKRIRV